MTVALQAFPQFLDNAGVSLSGGKLFSFQAGTLTPLATFTDRGGGTPNANPVVLDSAGRADIWLSTNTAYKLRLEDAVGNVLDTIDDFYAGADPSQLTAAGIVPATGGTYTGLVSFTGGATFDGTAAQDLATLDSLNIASVVTSNFWINPDAGINQRVATTVADGGYGFDRIVNLCETGSVTISQLAQPTDGIPFALRMTQPDAVAKRIGSLQIVEARNCLAYRAGNVVFAPKVRCSVAATVRVALIAWTGTQDAPTRDVVNSWTSTNYTAGNFFVANTLTIAVGATALAANTWTDVAVSSASAGGVVMPSTTQNLYLFYWTDSAVAQNVTLDASVFRSGRGTSIPLWSPPDAETELAKCQRYFSKSYRQAVKPGTNTGIADGGEDGPGTGTSFSSLIGRVLFPVSMRTPTPTVVTYDAIGGPATITCFLPAQNNGQGCTVDNFSERGFKIFTLSANPSRYFFHWTADTEL